jgi:hypothetical protein
VPASARGMLVNVATVTPTAGERIPVCDPDCEAAVSVPPAPAVHQGCPAPVRGRTAAGVYGDSFQRRAIGRLRGADQ